MRVAVLRKRRAEVACGHIQYRDCVSQPLATVACWYTARPQLVKPSSAAPLSRASAMVFTDGDKRGRKESGHAPSPGVRNDHTLSPSVMEGCIVTTRWPPSDGGVHSDHTLSTQWWRCAQWPHAVHSVMEGCTVTTRCPPSDGGVHNEL